MMWFLDVQSLLLCIIIPILQTSKKGQQLSVPQKKCKQRVECSSKKRFLIVYDHFDSYIMKTSQSSSSNIKDNTGIMSHLNNHSNNDNSTTGVTDTDVGPSVDNDNVSMATDNSSLPTISVTEPHSPSPTPLSLTDNSHRGEVIDFLGDACSSDCSDLETLTQADRRDLGPGTRTDVSPLMKMELSKQRAALRHSSPSKIPPSKRMCQRAGGCS